MSFKKFTILLVPDNLKEVRQFKIPYFFLPIIFLFMVSWVTYVGWIIFDYKIIRPQMLTLAQLENENRHQKTQFIHLARRFDQMKQKLEELKVYKPEKTAKWGTTDDNGHLYGIGGSYLHLVGSTFSMDVIHWEQVPSRHTLWASINNKTFTTYLPEVEEPSLLRKWEDTDTAIPNIDKKSTFKGRKGKIRKQLKAIAMELGLDPNLALSMAKVESGYHPKKVSPKGAIGVLQVMPKLALHEFDIPREKLFDPQVNIRVGLSWMKYLLERFDNNLDLSLAAYNAGVSRVIRAGYKIPRIKETKNYVKRVKKAMKEETEA